MLDVGDKVTVGQCQCHYCPCTADLWAEVVAVQDGLPGNVTLLPIGVAAGTGLCDACYALIIEQSSKTTS